MRIRVETNFNYYEDSPLPNTDILPYPSNRFNEVFNQFYGKRTKKKDDGIKDLFSSIFCLTTKDLKDNDNYKDLIISPVRRKIDSDEDSLILKLYSKKEPTSGKVNYFIQSGLYAGVLYIPSKSGVVEIHIEPRYGQVLLNRMLNVANHFFMDTGSLTAAKLEDNDNCFKYIIEYLFLHSFEKARLVGLPRQYKQIKNRLKKYKGTLDVARHIVQDIPFKGVLSLSYREQVVPQELIDILYTTLRCLHKSAYNAIKVRQFEQELKPMYSGRRLKICDVHKVQRNKSLQNPLYSPFKKVLKYAEIILKHYNIAYDERSNESRIKGYLIDASELWEIYLENLLRSNFPDWNVMGQYEIIFYDKTTFFGRKLMPDLILQKADKVAVFDAKFKTMQGRRQDVDLSDLRQIHTYAGFFSKENDLLVAGLIYPCEGKHSEKWEADICSKTLNEAKFVIEGINVEKIQIGNSANAFESLIEEEKVFIDRIRKYLGN